MYDDDAGFIIGMFFVWGLILLLIAVMFAHSDPTPEEVRCTDAGGVWVKKHCLTEYKIPVRESPK
jgi:hypothetical protein